MVDNSFPKLAFTYPFDHAAAYDAESRGYVGYAFVELGNGGRYPVVFYDPIRLQQDLEVEVSEGRAFIAEPGMIVVPEVTLARMQDAIVRLYQNGFFDSLVCERPSQTTGLQTTETTGSSETTRRTTGSDV
jgi:hypothetical protein